jgi:hypothetical protein
MALGGDGECRCCCGPPLRLTEGGEEERGALRDWRLLLLLLLLLLLPPLPVPVLELFFMPPDVYSSCQSSADTNWIRLGWGLEVGVWDVIDSEGRG